MTAAIEDVSSLPGKKVSDQDQNPIGEIKEIYAIDGDGHGNGPFRIRLALTRTPDDRFLLDATETDDQAPGPVNLLMHPDVPRSVRAQGITLRRTWSSKLHLLP